MSLATPDNVLDFWIGQAVVSGEAAKEKNKLWFMKSEKTDRTLEARFGETLAALKDGLANEWAAAGPRARLAAIIVLDQFSRNIHRGTPLSFAADPLALRLAKAGIAAGEDANLYEAERMFLYLPLEHSENAADQAASLANFTNLAADARPEFAGFVKSALDYARRHKDVIDQFGRFPHRNAILGRASTPAEEAYLAKPGSGF